MENQENELVQELRNINVRLQDLWNEIGFDPDECGQRLSRITELVKDLLQRVLEGETTIRKKLLKSIEENGKEFYYLNTELGSSIPDPEESLGLLELERYLRYNVEKLHGEVKRRRDKLKELQAQDQELCECLIEDPLSFSKRKIPTEEDLKDLERRISTLEQEKINRQKTFRRLKSTLASLMEELQQKANSSFEHQIMSDVEDLFTLSLQNLQQMKQLNEEYEQKVKENEKESLQLQEQIRYLYDRLGIDPIERDNFLGTVYGCTPSTIKKLREELERLGELKRQNMARFINQLRRELEAFWEKCYISEDERNAFTPYVSEHYTEEVLEAHDREVQKLQTYYAENKHIFFKIKHRHELWRKLMDLEERANDPNRLFGNRGCSLLQEEKERKRVKNEMPRVERELEDHVHTWETKHGRPFLVDGKSVSEYILDQWHKYSEHKEQERKQRQTARIKQLNTESRLGSRPQPVKRRVARNDTMRTPKLRRIGETEPSGSSAPSTPVGGRKNVLQEHNPKILKNVTMQISSKKEGASFSSNEVSTYSQFSDGILRRSERENIRSSVSHGLKKTPQLVNHTTPRRPPPGLPKTPKTLPRVATRRSARLSSTRTKCRSPQNSTALRMTVSPAPSTTFRSPCAGVSRLMTPNRWSKLSFLI